MNIRPATPEALEWFSKRASHPVDSSFRGFEAEDEGKTLAVIGFDSWMPSSAQIHIAAVNPFAIRPLLLPAAHFAFVQCRLSVVLAMICENAQSARIARWMGFRRSYSIPDGWAQGEALVIYELRREFSRVRTDFTRKAA